MIRVRIKKNLKRKLMSKRKMLRRVEKMMRRRKKKMMRVEMRKKMREKMMMRMKMMLMRRRKKRMMRELLIGALGQHCHWFQPFVRSHLAIVIMAIIILMMVIGYYD